MLTAREIAETIEQEQPEGSVLIEAVCGPAEVSDLVGAEETDYIWARVREINCFLEHHAVSPDSAYWLTCDDCVMAIVDDDLSALEYRGDGSVELCQAWLDRMPRLGHVTSAYLAPSRGDLHCESCGQDMWGDLVHLLVRV